MPDANKALGVFSVGVNSVASGSNFHDLQFAASDAIQFSRELRDIFTVSHEITITDSIEIGSGMLPTRSRILLELNKFVQKLLSDDIHTAIFLFTGHGILTNQGFAFCCRDFESEIPNVTGIVLDDVFDVLAKFKGRKLFLFDCCRSYFDSSKGEFIGESVLPDIQHRLSLNDTILYACRPGETSIELASKSSRFGGVFVNEFITALRSNDLQHVDLNDLYPSIKENVATMASQLKYQQTPTIFGCDLSDFVFYRK